MGSMSQNALISGISMSFHVVFKVQDRSRPALGRSILSIGTKELFLNGACKCNNTKDSLEPDCPTQQSSLSVLAAQIDIDADINTVGRARDIYEGLRVSSFCTAPT